LFSFLSFDWCLGITSLDEGNIPFKKKNQGLMERKMKTKKAKGNQNKNVTMSVRKTGLRQDYYYLLRMQLTHGMEI